MTGASHPQPVLYFPTLSSPMGQSAHVRVLPVKHHGMSRLPWFAMMHPQPMPLADQAVVHAHALPVTEPPLKHSLRAAFHIQSGEFLLFFSPSPVEVGLQNVGLPQAPYVCGHGRGAKSGFLLLSGSHCTCDS